MSFLDRTTAALRRRLTLPVVFIALFFLGASILGSIELFLTDLPLAGVAALLLGGGLLLLTWKVQGSNTATREQLRKILAMTVSPTTAPVPVEVPPASGAAHQPKATHRDEASLSEAMASYKLHALLHGAPAGTPSRRRIAFIGSPALGEELTGIGRVVRLHPRMSVAEIEHAMPDTLVMEEGAFDRGPWIGALSAHGSQLLAELCSAVQLMRHYDAAVFVLASPDQQQAGATALRRDTIVLDRSTVARLSPDTPSPLMSVLASHVKESAA